MDYHKKLTEIKQWITNAKCDATNIDWDLFETYRKWLVEQLENKSGQMDFKSKITTALDDLHSISVSKGKRGKLIAENLKPVEEFRVEADSSTNSDVQINQKESLDKKTKLLRTVLATMGAVALVAMASLLWIGNCNHENQRHEFFIEFDLVEAVGASFHLPFAIKLPGENNNLELRLNNIERVFPYKGRVSVVLHGQATLSDAESTAVREKTEAALRFSVALAVVDGQFLSIGDAELDSLKVYSDNPDVEAIVQRKTAECWRQFVSSHTPWTMDINGLPFKPERDVQLEDNGVFVFGEEARR